MQTYICAKNVIHTVHEFGTIVNKRNIKQVKITKKVICIKFGTKLQFWLRSMAVTLLCIWTILLYKSYPGPYPGRVAIKITNFKMFNPRLAHYVSRGNFGPIIKPLNLFVPIKIFLCAKLAPPPWLKSCVHPCSRTLLCIFYLITLLPNVGKHCSSKYRGYIYKTVVAAKCLLL